MSMAPLDLDFQGPAPRRLRWIAWLALAVVAALAVAVADRRASLQTRTDTLEARNDGLAKRLRPRDAAREAAPSAETAQRIQRANAVIQRLALPWERLFSAVEAADARGLALLALEPNARDSTLRLSGEVRTVDELLAYVDRLARQPGLQQVHVVSFDTVERDGTQVIAFTLSARWLAA